MIPVTERLYIFDSGIIVDSEVIVYASDYCVLSLKVIPYGKENYFMENLKEYMIE